MAKELLPYAKAAAVGHLDRIPQYYKVFCSVNGLSADQLHGKVYKRNLIELRRAFIASMIKIYDQKILYTGTIKPSMYNGFKTMLTTTIGITLQHLHRDFSNSIFHYTTYESFKIMVDEIVSKMPALPEDKNREV